MVEFVNDFKNSKKYQELLFSKCYNFGFEGIIMKIFKSYEERLSIVFFLV